MGSGSDAKFQKGSHAAGQHNARFRVSVRQGNSEIHHGSFSRRAPKRPIRNTYLTTCCNLFHRTSRRCRHETQAALYQELSNSNVGAEAIRGTVQLTYRLARAKAALTRDAIWFATNPSSLKSLQTE